MGSGESKRRVVVEDADGEEIVTVTEAVVRRMKGLPDLDNKTADDHPLVTMHRDRGLADLGLDLDQLVDYNRFNTKAGPRAPPPTPEAPAPSFTNTRQADLDRATAVLKKEAEDFYLQKIKDLQHRNSQLQQQTNEQFALAVQEVEKKFMNVTASPVCQDLQAKVLECYQANGSEPLNCSALVNAFASCVDRARVAASTSQVQAVS
ncbi:hypothetical protein RRG08_001861 [Elysia crispata]|uniref:MICOS complex subunit MIC19 n=1 Tax=Elysia crispata TaxID=231223 RepID=A0AAE1A3Z7_9GAST|nr:hypothetical protein RRG08_001861 [Elysia crispata]